MCAPLAPRALTRASLTSQARCACRLRSIVSSSSRRATSPRRAAIACSASAREMTTTRAWKRKRLRRGRRRGGRESFFLSFFIAARRRSSREPRNHKSANSEGDLGVCEYYQFTLHIRTQPATHSATLTRHIQRMPTHSADDQSTFPNAHSREDCFDEHFLSPLVFVDTRPSSPSCFSSATLAATTNRAFWSTRSPRCRSALPAQRSETK